MIFVRFFFLEMATILVITTASTKRGRATPVNTCTFNGDGTQKKKQQKPQCIRVNNKMFEQKNKKPLNERKLIKIDS